MLTYLDFEKGLAELEGKAEELRALARQDPAMNIADEVAQLEQKARTHLAEIYARLSPWGKTQVARHPGRPHALDYVEGLIEEFTPLAGDRVFGEDAAIISGLGRFRGRPVMVLGQEKGSDTQTRLHRNFGMARPEGYRKAVRLMEMADRFGLPVLTFIDTPGAYPGKGAEERGQAEAIARSTEKGLEIGVPLIATVIGEGGSGGAVAFAAANHVIMLEHSIYSVISPEGCASILWKDSAKAQEAAAALRITAQDLYKLGVIDAVAPEPVGGAHRDKAAAVAAVGTAIDEGLARFAGFERGALRQQRREKFLAMGARGLE
ncbi:acetyl-CoA carboxylase carboxyltransferase subunit alpha [Neomegalonema sp.]|uniref:acetyl-CoA carboxylase carboxyltransferase subunit alpha n=1 Tax=Neomegalonema sp. TaxID=2039713 RepID=UPI0026201F4C|nr:acetyl-CoA carboxylase carboxyltransferase subunit alpha [Neomegalonema sp.]MDD2869396.1 acetyl-CoA carboxylase carboxyltransferase subunit alpha [Neomegalonema sp.]